MVYGRSYDYIPPCACGNKKPKNGSGCVVCTEPGCEDCLNPAPEDKLICNHCQQEADPDCTCTEVRVDVDRSERGEGECAVHGR